MCFEKVNSILLLGLVLIAAAGCMLVSCGQKTDTITEPAIVVDSTTSADITSLA